MRSVTIKNFGTCIITLLLSLLPVVALAQTVNVLASPPPISQPLITEGALAIQLVTTLGVSSATDEITAESDLGDAGIAPRNGWIADYPVTPDIVAEVRQSVADAVDKGSLSLNRDEALKRYDSTVAGFDLTVRSYMGSEQASDSPETCENYPNPAIINNTYSNEGPPIVTYYCPPPDYYYQYDWVPYPFWWTDFWFPGFFILRDFDRHVFMHRHFMHFSNHFNDVRRHRMFRIDPVDRYHGKTYAGIGVKSTHNFISTGVPHSPQAIFNAPRGGVHDVGGAHSGIPSGGSASHGAGSRSGAPYGVNPGGGVVHGGGAGVVHGGGAGVVHGGGAGVVHGGGGGMHGGGGGMHGGGGGGGKR